MNIFNILTLQSYLPESERQNVLQFMPKDPSTVSKIWILARSGHFWGTYETLANEVEMEAFKASVVAQEAGEVEVGRPPIDAEL